MPSAKTSVQQELPNRARESTWIFLCRQPIPGRMRIRVRGLYRSETLKRALEALPRSVPGLHAVAASAVTGNALVEFDPRRSPAELIAELESCARENAPPPVVPSAAPQLSTEISAAPPKRRPKQNLARALAPGRPPRESWHTLAPEQVASKLDVEPAGLASDAAARRLSQYGRNVLEEAKKESPLAMFLGQFANPPVALLGLSAAVSVATGGAADAIVILGVVAINAVIGFVTEVQAERTINALGHMGPTRAEVIRDGAEVSVGVDEVVPGDVLVLSPGSFVAADARLLAGNQLTVDESALTGESLPVGKEHGFVGTLETPLGDRRNMLHMGTVVTGGSGRALVVATGHDTEIGLIQSLVGEVKTPDTPMQRQLDEMGVQLAIASAGICGVVFGLGLLRGMPLLHMLKTAISLAVAAIPEGLPTVATSTLALGIREMKRRKVLIRHLPAVESLGSVQTLCFDKTGTLTENRMRVVNIRTLSQDIDLCPDGRFLVGGTAIDPDAAPDLCRLFEVVALNSEVKLNGEKSGPPLDGSPTETALLEIAIHGGRDVAGLRESHPLVKAEHRAEGRPYMVTAHQTGEPEHFVAVKGSPTHVMELCTHYLDGGEPKPLDEALRQRIVDQNEAMAGQALRVLGMAFGHSPDLDGDGLVQKLVWLGLAGMEDTLREGMAELIAQFHEAGIQTVMITGDQSATAYSFGQRLGLNHDRPLEILDSTNLDKIEPEVLKGIVGDTTVFARVSPAHKLRIVQALQANGRVVAMTGDGINDGPALKASDVGVALGEKGSEVARSVADVVLEEDDLHTMIIAVEQGRTIYANIRKSLQYLLSGNMAEIEIMLVTTALGMGEALNPIQLLWVNLVTDILPAIGLSLEPPETDVLREKPRDPQEKIIRRSDMARLLRESVVVSAGTLGVYGYSLMRYGAGPAASTNSFMTLVMSQMLHAISCRSEKTTVLNRERRGNPALTASVAATLGVQVFAAYFPPLRGLLRLAPITLGDWAAIAVGSTLPFVVNEGLKLLPASRPDSPVPHSSPKGEFQTVATRRATGTRLEDDR